MPKAAYLRYRQARQKGQYTHIKDVLLENIEIIDRASQMDGGLTGVTTGFKYLDVMTSGLQRSDLIILAARPAMGKTAFALSLALNAAVKGNASVMVFSMEMSKEQLGQPTPFPWNPRCRCRASRQAGWKDVTGMISI